MIAPRADGILVRRSDGTVDRYSLDNPHPEFSWRALLGRVWYEGYPHPSYVWQSTGASEEFESKLSLVPLIVGTIKATAYALVFAVPLAVMGALYTSQFVHPKVKAKIKPTVEIMAALPSVVIGFVAGLWLASRVEAALVPILLMIGAASAVRDERRSALGSPAAGAPEAAATWHGDPLDPAAAAASAAGRPSPPGPGSRASSSAATPSSGSRARSVSSTTSATASSSGSPWASP